MKNNEAGKEDWVYWTKMKSLILKRRPNQSTIEQEFGSIIKEERIMVSWDNWSGIFIMQMPGMNTASSDDLIKEIYEFLAKTDLPDD